MTDIGFAPREVIAPQECRLKVQAAYAVETYGPQLAFELEVLSGEHAGHVFPDYADRDKHSGQVVQGTKAWSLFEACLGKGFHERRGITLESLIGEQFAAWVTQTSTGSRNKLEVGTIRSVPPEEKAPQPDEDGDDEKDWFDNFAL